MAGFDDIAKKAQQMLNDPKVKDALQGEKAEKVSDQVLDAVAGAVDKATGGKHTDAIKKGRDAVDDKIGGQGGQGGQGGRSGERGTHGGDEGATPGAR